MGPNDDHGNSVSNLTVVFSERAMSVDVLWSGALSRMHGTCWPCSKKGVGDT